MIHLADDATQTVFIILASKAADLMSIRRESLSGWDGYTIGFFTQYRQDG